MSAQMSLLVQKNPQTTDTMGYKLVEGTLVLSQCILVHSWRSLPRPLYHWAQCQRSQEGCTMEEGHFFDLWLF